MEKSPFLVLVNHIKTGQRALAFALFLLPFFLLNAHELFSKDSTCQNWFGYLHCADSFKSYYHFAYRVGYYLSAISWLFGGYLFHSRLSKIRWVYVVAISFCIARLINLISSKEFFGWHDEILNFLIVIGIFRICSYVFKQKKKELEGEDLFYLARTHHELISDVDRKIQIAKKLFKNGKIEVEDFARRVDVQTMRMKQSIEQIDQFIENGG